MMEPIDSLGYQIFFDDELTALYPFIQAGNYSKVLVLVDRNTAEYCLPIFQKYLPALDDYDIIEIDPGEENKNIDFCIGIWQMMIDFGADRKSLLINLGGGVVTDMGGFAASTFKRGFDFVHVPTTLLSQVDASVGGKTGIDMGDIKNIIGTFSQPKAVFISSLFLETLDQRELTSGLAEMIKHGLIQDQEYYEQIKQLDLSQITVEHIRRSVAMKSEVVFSDPHEEGIRKILNFGHTIGHAVEGYSLIHSTHPLLHGEAIAVGMICESYLSHKMNGLPESELDDIVSTFRRLYPDYLLNTQHYDVLLDIMSNDKKNLQEKIGFSLLNQIGSATFGQYVTREMIVESLDYYREVTKN